MASRINRPNGHRWIQFKDTGGARKTLRLGKMSADDADSVKRRVEALLSAQIIGCLPDEETARWITALPLPLAAKFAAVGLIEKRLASTVGELTEYSKKHLTCSSVTATNEHRYTRQHLAKHFGDDRKLHTITQAEARKFLSWMHETFAKTTAGKRCEKAKGYFKTAVENRWLTANPFDGVSTKVKAPRDRDVTVSHEMCQKILAEIADPKFQLVFALARYGAIRTPSEINQLEWNHVRWDDDQIIIWVPKTEDHRVIPIFPEIRPYLNAVWDLPETGDRVLGGWTPTNGGLTSRLKKVLNRMGLKIWKKPWQNMRPTRENELLEVFPQHVVLAWLGHTRQVAEDYYHRVSKEHYQRAAHPGQKADAKPEVEVGGARQGIG